MAIGIVNNNWGQSGSGKETMVRASATIRSPSEGRRWGYEGEDSVSMPSRLEAQLMKKQELKITLIGQTFKGTLGVHVNFQDEFRDRDFIAIPSFKYTRRKLILIKRQII